MDSRSDKNDCENEQDNEESTFITSESKVLSRMALNDNKAGMKGLDKEKINRIIHENSVGSKFYENERKKDAQVDARIKKMLEQVDNLSPDQKKVAIGQTNAILSELERTRDLSRTIVHIDMDAFYASVEERENPDLKNKPMAVGGMGMLSTSNYIARRYGVRAGMPGFIGKKLCPELILAPCNFAKYTEISHQVRKVLAEYDPNFSPMGLDEAYLDITSHLETRHLLSEADRTFIKIEDESDKAAKEGEKVIFGMSAEDVVNEMRLKIQIETRLTASAGIASNTLLSKIASDMNKPNGQFYLEPTREAVMKFIRNLSIRKVSGIGKVSEKMLNGIGVKTCQDIYDERAVIYAIFSRTMSSYLLRICTGIGSTILENNSEQKSISTERTFRDISNPQEMLKKCEELCDALEADTKKANVKGFTITLKIKTSSFELHTRSKTLFHPVSCKSEIYPVIADLLKQELTIKNGQMKLRLIGVGISKLTKTGSEAQQKSLDYFMQKATNVKRKVEDSSLLVHNQEPSTVAEDVLSSGDDDTEPSVEREHSNGAENNNVEEKVKVVGFVNNEETPSTPEVNNVASTSAKKYCCPICETEFDDLSSINSHIDECAIIQNDSTSTSANNNATLDYDTNKTESNNNTLSFDGKISCLTCPICNSTFCSQDITLAKFNTHVDSCLNRKTIMELVKSETQSHIKRNKRNSLNAGPSKKRQKKGQKPSCTLDRFFK